MVLSELAPPLHTGVLLDGESLVAAARAVQVDIKLTLGLKALGCQPVESTSPFKVLAFRWVNLHPYSAEEALAKAEAKSKFALARGDMKVR